MPIAYLIAAHHQPAHLARLIRALNSPDALFFIHIDAKVDETIFSDTVPHLPNVFFIEERWEVNWGGFSIVRSTLSLLDTAAGFDSNISRFCLLSGSDFPIKTRQEISTALVSTKELLRVDKKLDPSGDDWHSGYIRFYWFPDGPEDKKKFSGKLPRPKSFDRLGLYHGSAWWALTRPCIEYVLDFAKSNDDYCKFLEHAFCSDEIFFQSILKQSPFAQQITHDFETASDLSKFQRSNDHGCHYVDWNSPTDPRPKILEMEDFDHLMNSNCTFARKFQEQRSGELITRLEETLLLT